MKLFGNKCLPVNSSIIAQDLDVLVYNQWLLMQPRIFAVAANFSQGFIYTYIWGGGGKNQGVECKAISTK
jgi:hypothetical protein